MPISLALLLCIPIGILFYFEARWLVRKFASCGEQMQRRIARTWGIFGAMLIPLIYCFGMIESAISGTLGKVLASGFFMIAGLVLLNPVVMARNKGN